MKITPGEGHQTSVSKTKHNETLYFTQLQVPKSQATEETLENTTAFCLAFLKMSLM